MLKQNYTFDGILLHRFPLDGRGREWKIANERRRVGRASDLAVIFIVPKENSLIGAVNAVRGAYKEANVRGHATVTPEHLLLAISNNHQAQAWQYLVALELSLAGLAGQIESLLPPSTIEKKAK